MNYETRTYRDYVKSGLEERQALNTSYSLRAMARDLAMPPSTLSLVLKGDRELPRKKLVEMIDFLSLSPLEESFFREDYFKKRIKIDQISISSHYKNRAMIDENKFNILAEWEYYAVLTMIECKSFKSDNTWISRKLGIKLKRANEVIQGLLLSKLITRDEKSRYILTQGPLRTTEDVTSKALKKSHTETLELGKKKLQEIPIELRDFSSMTVAVNLDKIQEAKTIIREFRQKLATLLRDGEKQEVYQLAIQLFPLTTINNGES